MCALSQSGGSGLSGFSGLKTGRQFIVWIADWTDWAEDTDKQSPGESTKCPLHVSRITHHANMSPRWGLKTFGYPMVYKHAAPLGLNTSTLP